MPLDFASLASALLSRSRDLLPAWLPGGKIVGTRYVCSNLQGGSGDSLSIGINTGQWADFATPDLKGGDLISLYAAIHNIKQGDAFHQLAGEFNLSSGVSVPPSEPEYKIGKPPADASVPDFGSPVLIHEYLDSDGSLINYICRYGNNGKKFFQPYSWDLNSQHWVKKSYPSLRPLYGLDIIRSRPTDPILVVEGEKSADAARKFIGHKYVVISWPNGANAWNKADWNPVYGRKVAFWPDADEPGVKAMEAIAAHIYSKVIEPVKILDVSDHKDGWDAADALQEGWNWAKFYEWAKDRGRTFIPKIVPVEASGAPKSSSPDEPPLGVSAIVDKCGLAQSGGKPILNMTNVIKVIEVMFPGMVWSDTFHNKIFTKWNGGLREWSDADTRYFLTVLQSGYGFVKLSKEICFDGIMAYADQHAVNEPREWMNNLEWDGTSRIDEFFTKYMGANDSLYTMAVSKNFWISIVARVMDPGCQVDNMVVLEGPQGTFKSTSIKAIGGEWTAQAGAEITNKDFFLSLQGKILMEIPELDSFKKVGITEIKKVVSCSVDRLREPYARTTKDFKRTCIFIGTTNETHYLMDNTGARRFWPIKIGKIDLAMIKNDREQLFAEAVSRFKQGEKWYLMPDEAEIEQEERREVDVWEPLVEQYMKTRIEGATILEIAEELGIKKDRVDTQITRRLNRILRVLEYYPETVKQPGGSTVRIFKTASST